MFFIVLYTLCLLIVFLLVLYIRNLYTFWDDQGIPNVRPRFPFGNIGSAVTGKTHVVNVIQEIYEKLKDTSVLGGFYLFFRPYLLITDLDMLRNICNTSFQHFHDRALYHNEKDDPLSMNLVSLEGERWVNVRKKLTPVFSVGKVKQMFPLIKAVADELVQTIDADMKSSPTVKITNFIERYAIDVIGTCAFGIECNCLKNPNAKFREIGLKVAQDNWTTLKLFMFTPLQDLARKLHIRVFPKRVSDFFLNLMKETFAFRKLHNVKRMDLVHYFMQLNKDTADAGADDDNNKFLTMNEISANAFIFFFAGFDTAASTVSFLMYEMAKNQEIQDKARECIYQAIAKTGGEFTVESLSHIQYIDKCVSEILRKYPAVPMTSRKVTKELKVPDTNYVLKKDYGIIICSYAIHHDPKYYPDPEKFDPERFSLEECAKRNPYAYMPFGSGPRFCIGYNFAMSEVKIAFISVLMNYRLHPTTSAPIKFSRTSINLVAANGIDLRFEKLIK